MTTQSLDAPTFAALGVPAELSAVLADLGITVPTPIQAATLPDSFAGRDVLGRGRTGSGKTYAFLLPLVARLAASGRPAASRRPRALILAPTRELVGQIHAALKPLAETAGLTTVTVFGGVGQNPQVTGLRNGVDIVLACPGRLEDLIGQGHCDLGAVEVTVLDEADHMADLGFLPAVRRLLERDPAAAASDCSSPRRSTRPSTCWSASSSSTRSPTRPTRPSRRSRAWPTTCCTCSASSGCRSWSSLTSAPGRTVVFTRTKHGAKALARQLNKNGVPSVELHGNLAQNARTRNLDAFHSGKASTLVATDIAARGIHVDDVALVVHADPPVEHKAYLHRSGRTARAGAAGTVITLMTDDQVRDVRTLTRQAGIKPTTTKVPGPGHPILVELAPGERTLVPGGYAPAAPPAGRSAGEQGQARSGGGGRNRSRRGRGKGAAKGNGAASGQSRSQHKTSGQKSQPSRNRSHRGGGGGGHTAASFSSGRR